MKSRSPVHNLSQNAIGQSSKSKGTTPSSLTLPREICKHIRGYEFIFPCRNSRFRKPPSLSTVFQQKLSLRSACQLSPARTGVIHPIVYPGSPTQTSYQPQQFSIVRVYSYLFRSVLVAFPDGG